MNKHMAHAATAAKVTVVSPTTKKRNQIGDLNALRVGEGRKWALFREAKRRLEYGVPVGVLIQYVTIKLQTMGEVHDERD